MEYDLKPLSVSSELLHWEDSPIYYPAMVRIITPMDGENAFFYAILNAFYFPYREGILFNQQISQRQLVNMFRQELITSLNVPVHNGNENDTYLSIIGNGYYLKNSPDPTDLERQLKSNTSISYIVREHVSNVVNKDIYIIDASTQDIHVSPSDLQLLYKQRVSIFILKLSHHYELLGCRKPNGDFQTSFMPDHPWVKKIYTLINRRLCS